MTKLSVNVNKIALLRNSRGGNLPNVEQVALDCERFGADGITVHPRPDQRHITNEDVFNLKNIVKGEFNVEGYPSDSFIQMMQEVKPDQCTLVPDPPDALTSSDGWDTIKYHDLLVQVISELKSRGIRVSLFVNPVERFVEGAARVEADRIEFYTGPYAYDYNDNREKAIKEYVSTAIYCNKLGLGINAGHDLNLDNLKFFKHQIPDLLEVSIGHALVADSLYLGLENTIQLYQRQLK